MNYKLRRLISYPQVIFNLSDTLVIATILSIIFTWATKFSLALYIVIILSITAIIVTLIAVIIRIESRIVSVYKREISDRKARQIELHNELKLVVDELSYIQDRVAKFKEKASNDLSEPYAKKMDNVINMAEKMQIDMAAIVAAGSHQQVSSEEGDAERNDC